MSAADNGGPAFPAPGLSSLPNDNFIYPEAGMTLRDYFAAKALQGLLAQSMGTALGSDPKLAAEYAYAAADEMLKARSS